MNIWSVPEIAIHLTVLIGALVFIPMFRRLLGGPWWAYTATFCGVVILTAAEIHRLILAMQQPGPNGPILWFLACFQAAGYLVLFVGLMLLVRYLLSYRADLSRMATTDSLTGLCNRHQAILMFQHEIDRAKRDGAPLSIILIDLDRLKPINDRLGHLAGDDALKHLAEILKRRARRSDIVARYGGDEFLVILPRAVAKAAIDVATEHDLVLREVPLKYGDNEVFLQASFGVAELAPGQDLSLEDLLARADDALYSVKRKGGGGVADWANFDGTRQGAP